MRADLHPREAERLAVLQRLEILDREAEKEFADIAELAASICGAPIALVSLLDETRQWFMASAGTELKETPRDQAICAHAILSEEVTVIPDTLTDSRTQDNPLCYGETSVRFYAGAVLEIDDGLPIGTLCVLDTSARTLSDEQLQALKVLARQVETRIALKRELQRSKLMGKEIDHRVKNSLSLIGSMLSLQGRSVQSEEARQAIELARSRVMAVTRVHEQLHDAAEAHEVDLCAFLQRLADDLMAQGGDVVEITVACPTIMLNARDSVSVGLAVNEIVTNALRHGFEPGQEGRIEISGRRNDGIIEVEISNNGKPLPEGFDPGKSRGLGMRVVGSTARQKGGELKWSQDDDGVRFMFSFEDAGSGAPA